MHSLVFCLTTKFDKDELESAYYNLSEEDIINEIGADYATERESFTEFSEDVKWFSKVYKCPVTWENYKLGDEEEIKVAKVEVKPVLESIKNEIQNRLEDIHKELKEENPSLWKIAYIAYNQRESYFYAPGWGLVPMIELPDYIAANPGDYIYIVKSFDYHF